MAALSKNNLKKQHRKLKPKTSPENLLLDAILKIFQIKLPEKATTADLRKAITKIKYDKIDSYISKYSVNLFRQNRDGFLNILNVLLQNKSATEKKRLELDAANRTMMSDIRMYKPLMEQFQRNVQLIKDIPFDVVTRLEKAYAQGVSFRGTELEKYLRERLGARAKLIVRTESSKLNTAITEIRSVRLKIPAYIWSTSEDQRVRASHKLMNGVLVFWGTRLTLDKMSGHAGEFPNCLTGDTLVNPAFGIQKLYCRKYTGKLITVTLDNGTTISSTPNHPFLSKTGWVALDKLNVGDYLFEVRPNSSALSLASKLFSEFDCDKQKPTFSQIFSALSYLGVGINSVCSGARSQFHNDGIVNEQVNIIDVDSFLNDNFVSSAIKVLKKLNLEIPGLSVSTRLFPAECPMASFGMGVNPTPNRVVCRRCVFRILFARPKGHHNTIRLQTCPCINAMLSKKTVNASSAHIEFFRKRENAYTAIVLLDYLLRRKMYIKGVMGDCSGIFLPNDDSSGFKTSGNNVACDVNTFSNFLQRKSLLVQPLRIVNKTVSDFCGHVYNLQSDCNYYTIQGNICQHNCRCVPLPIAELSDIQFPVKVAEGNLTVISKYIKGTHGKKYNTQILSGQIKTYTKEEFMRAYGNLFVRK